MLNLTPEQLRLLDSLFASSLPHIIVLCFVVSSFARMAVSLGCDFGNWLYRLLKTCRTMKAANHD